MKLLAEYLDYLYEGNLLNFSKKLKKNVRAIILSRVKPGNKTLTNPEIIKKIKILQQKNHELFLNDRISSSEYMKRIKRLKSMEY
jgi:hypothetical protein